LAWVRPEDAPDLGDAFGHRHQSHPWLPRLVGVGGGGADVADLETQHAVVDGQVDGGLVGMDVAGDVGQGLGGDPQGGHLHRGRQGGQDGGCLQGGGDAVAVESVDLLAERAEQAQLIQGRRS